MPKRTSGIRDNVVGFTILCISSSYFEDVILFEKDSYYDGDKVRNETLYSLEPKNGFVTKFFLQTIHVIRFHFIIFHPILPLQLIVNVIKK